MTSGVPAPSGWEVTPSPPAGFLDAASGEPLHPAARRVLHELLGDLAETSDPTLWADPDRRYGSARRVRIALDHAREGVATQLFCRADEVSFCASGTQSVHLGIRGLLEGRRRAGHRFVTSTVEHSAVLKAAEHHRAQGGTVELVAVDGAGRLDLDRWTAAVSAPDVALACLQSANHEVGTLQPLTEAAAVCSRAGVPMLVDAAQTLGRSTRMTAEWSVLSGSAHKWGGPAGVGVLAVRGGTRWRAAWPTDDREGHRVPGFPTVALILAASAALEASTQQSVEEDARLGSLVHRIRRTVLARVPDSIVLGPAEDRLPHVVTFSSLYVDGEAVLDELDHAGFSVSSGSSCSSSSLEPSHVLVAMGALSQGNIRVSLPRGVRESDVDRFLEILPGAVARVRSALGADRL